MILHKYITLLIIVLHCHLFSANLTFESKSASIVLNNDNSQLRLGNVDKVKGWGEHSIIRNVVYNSAHDWPEAYTSGVIIGSGAQKPTNHLIFNNSNAIVRIASSGGDSVLTRNNSNAIIVLDKNLRTDSNAFTYGIKNNSNAIIKLSEGFTPALVIQNSNAIVVLKNEINTIDHGPANITITDSLYTLSYNLYLSPLHFMNITHSTTINGQGFAINLTGSFANQIIIAPGLTVYMTNMTIFNFSENAFSIGNNAHLIFGDGTNIKLDPPQQITTTMTFSGNTWFSGVGNALEIKSGGNIVVTPGGHLTMHDMNIFGLSGNNIRCQGDTSSLTFKNTGINLASNYSFTSGRISFEEDVIISGTNVFEYRPTNINSGIASNSTLYVDTGITFSYAPDSANRDLLGMTDKSSHLYLNGCTLKSTTTGMRLTKGTLFVNYINDVINDNATSISEGFALGDGNVDHDVMIHVMPGGSLNVLSGILDYNNKN